MCTTPICSCFKNPEIFGIQYSASDLHITSNSTLYHANQFNFGVTLICIAVICMCVYLQAI